MSSFWYWSAIPVEDGRYLVFSKLLNRLYLLTEDQAGDNNLHFLLGLKETKQLVNIPDEARTVIHQFSELCKFNRIKAPLGLVLGYRFLHYTRFIPMGSVLWIIRNIARIKPDFILDESAIGKLVHHVEYTANLSDCYPRALLTAYLCLRHLGSCELYLGVLAPTKLMHAWCVARRMIPYEHLSEHFLYQPVLKTSQAI